MAADLAGTVALVTGAASGIGAAVTDRLASRGAQVVLVDRNAEAVRERAAAVDGIALETDVSDPEAMRLAVGEAERQLGRLDLVHLNAGTSGATVGRIGELDIARYRSVLGVNVDHVVFGIDAAVPAMQRCGGGTIVVTASLAGLVPMASDPIYTLTKHAVVGYIRALAGSLDPSVRVLALCPGFTETPLIATIRDRFTGFPLLTPDHVADAFEALVSDGASGEAWYVQPGRPAAPYGFRGVPGPVGGARPPDLSGDLP